MMNLIFSRNLINRIFKVFNYIEKCLLKIYFTNSQAFKLMHTASSTIKVGSFALPAFYLLAK